jgi:hypothetical protein
MQQYRGTYTRYLLQAGRDDATGHLVALLAQVDRPTKLSGSVEYGVGWPQTLLCQSAPVGGGIGPGWVVVNNAAQGFPIQPS